MRVSPPLPAVRVSVWPSVSLSAPPPPRSRSRGPPGPAARWRWRPPPGCRCPTRRSGSGCWRPRRCPWPRRSGGWRRYRCCRANSPGCWCRPRRRWPRRPRPVGELEGVVGAAAGEVREPGEADPVDRAHVAPGEAPGAVRVGPGQAVRGARAGEVLDAGPGAPMAVAVLVCSSTAPGLPYQEWSRVFTGGRPLRLPAREPPVRFWNPEKASAPFRLPLSAPVTSQVLLVSAPLRVLVAAPLPIPVPMFVQPPRPDRLDPEEYRARAGPEDRGRPVGMERAPTVHPSPSGTGAPRMAPVREGSRWLPGPPKGLQRPARGLAGHPERVGQPTGEGPGRAGSRDCHFDRQARAISKPESRGESDLPRWFSRRLPSRNPACPRRRPWPGG
jgi:hypothetical protein